MDPISENLYIASNAFARQVSGLIDRKVKPFGFTTSYALILIEAKKAGEISQKDISERFFLAPSTVTRFIDKMEKKELVKRIQNGKSVGITLTKKGELLALDVETAVGEAEDEIKEKLGSKYHETLTKMLHHGLSFVSGK